jgi:hypothetical protein
MTSDSLMPLAASSVPICSESRKKTSRRTSTGCSRSLVGGGSEPRGGPSHDPRHGRSGPASRVGPTRVAVIRG